MTVGLGPCAVATLSRAMHSRKGAEPTGHRRYICLHSIFASEVIRFSTVLVQSLRDCVKSHLASLRSMILEAWMRIIASLEEVLVS